MDFSPQGWSHRKDAYQMSSEMRVELLDLPLELLTEILSHLPPLDMMRVARCCRRLRSSVRCAYYNLSTARIPSNHQVERYFESLRESGTFLPSKLEVAYILPPMVPMLVRTFPQLLELRLVDRGVRVGGEIGREKLTSFRALEGLTSLRVLVLNLLSWRTEVVNLDFLGSLQELRELRLEGVRMVAEKRFQPGILSSLPRLRTLSLNLDECGGIAKLGSLTSLTSLNLGGCMGLKNVKWISPLTSLTSLSLGELRVVSSLQGLSSLTGLRELKLEGRLLATEDLSLPLLRPEVTEVVSKLTSLRELRLEEVGFSAEYLTPLVKLEVLELSSVYSGVVMCFPSTLTSLRELQVKVKMVVNLNLLVGVAPLLRVKLVRCTLWAWDSLFAMKLVRLELDSCSSLEDLPYSECIAVDELVLSGYSRRMVSRLLMRVTRVKKVVLSKCEVPSGICRSRKLKGPVEVVLRSCRDTTRGMVEYWLSGLQFTLTIEGPR